MRIILEFETGPDVLPTIRLENGTGSTSGTGSAPSLVSSIAASSGATDGGKAPNASGATASQESGIYELQHTTLQSGNTDGGPAVSAGSPTVNVNS